MAETGFRKWIIVVTVISAAVIELIDTSIVNVALNDMSASLGATIEDIAWVITAYAIANVIIIPMTSFLAALFGRRNYYVGSIILFTLASYFCGNATSIWELVAFRFIQGIGGGALLSTSQSILFDAFSYEERPLAAGIFSLGIVLGPTIGPTLGGWIIDNNSWQWIFYVNIPIGIIAALLSIKYVSEPKEKRKVGAIDWFGIFLLVVGIGALQIVLERGQSEDWFDTPYIVVLSVMAALAIVGFVWHELTTEHPVVDLRVLRSSTLAICAVLTFILGFGLFSSVFLVPVFVQRLLGYTAMQTGLLLLPGALLAAICLPIVGRIMQKGFSPQIFIFIGFVLTATFTYMLSFSSLESGVGDFFVPLLLRGLGLACISVPLTTLAISGLRGKDLPQGVALNNMMRQLGGSFGIAIVNTYLAHRYAANRSMLISHVTQYDFATQQRVGALTSGLVAKGVPLATAHQQALTVLNGLVSRQMLIKSFIDVFIFVTLFFVLCIPLILIVRSEKRALPAGVALDAH
ncbi:MAG: DHA2 family efflux MFS transporter permease subunit [Candidatus Kapaibacterium sp.]|jgi:DHA2 family multidrug resistance protein